MSGGQLDGRQPVVWIVEDDTVFLAALTEHLNREGYDTVGFPGSMEALTSFDAGERPDVLIADIMLPDGQPHGVALGSMLRLKQFDLPVIYVTGFADAAARVSPQETLFRKPVDMARLALAISSALGRGAATSG